MLRDEDSVVVLQMHSRLLQGIKREMVTELLESGRFVSFAKLNVSSFTDTPVNPEKNE